MLIPVRRSTGELLSSNGASFFGNGRAADPVPVRSSLPVAVRFFDDFGNRTALNPASGVLTFSAQPAVGDTFTVGNIVYTARGALTGAANEFLIGASLAASIANLVGAINAITSTGTNAQTPGTTYGTGTAANGLAGAAAYQANQIVFTARYADASGNAVVTTTTSTHASFNTPTLAGADVLSFDIKPVGQYDADPILPSPAFTAPLDPTSGDYSATLNTNIIQAIQLLEPNNPGKGLLTFTAQPAAGDTFTVGSTVYTARTALTGAANEVLIGASLAASIANLIGAINAATTGGQAAGTTYGTGTAANLLATAAAGSVANSIAFTSTPAGNTLAVPTSTTSAAASFGAAWLIPGSNTAVEPSTQPLMAQLSWGPDDNHLARSGQWTLNLNNVVRHPGQGVPVSAAGPLTQAIVQQAVAQAAAAAVKLAPTTVKTAAYTAAPQDLIPVNATAGNVPIALPTAPADGTPVAVKLVALSGTNTCTITCGGADVLDLAGGPASISLATLNESVILQYSAAVALWYVVEHGYSRSALDARFAAHPLVQTITATSGSVTVADGTTTVLFNAALTGTLNLTLPHTSAYQNGDTLALVDPLTYTSSTYPAVVTAATAAGDGLTLNEGGGASITFAGRKVVVLRKSGAVWTYDNATNVRANILAAKSGANSDINSLTGLTTPIPVTGGGTGASGPATARSNLGAAASGANSDITSLTGLATAALTGATPTLNWLNQGGSTLTLSANATISFSNAANGLSVSMAITNTTGNYTVTWPTGIKWAGGTAPTQTTGAHTDVYTFIQLGGVIYGNAAQNF